MAHKGKATSNVSFNLDDPPEAYTNKNVYDRVSDYTPATPSIHGLDYCPSTNDIDGETVMRIGGCKKHGHFWLGDGVIDTASTPTLS
jgi:hypothetical protein